MNWILITDDQATWPPDGMIILFAYKYSLCKRYFVVGKRNAKLETENDNQPYIWEVPDECTIGAYWTPIFEVGDDKNG